MGKTSSNCWYRGCGRLITTNEDADLIIDFGELLDYPSQVVVPAWGKREDYGLNINGDSQRIDYSNGIGFLFSFIEQEKASSTWVNQIPDRVIFLFKKHEELLRENWLLLYMVIGKSNYICDLLEFNPILLAILIHKASADDWSIDKFIKIANSKQVLILEACGLPFSKAIVKVTSRIDIKRLTVSDFQIVKSFLEIASTHNVNHIQSFTKQKMMFLIKFPELSKSGLLKSEYTDKEWKEFIAIFKDTTRMADLLVITDTLRRISQLKTIVELEAFHDKLSRDYTKVLIAKTENILFPTPPIKGTDTIVPIIDLHELIEEGQKQNHCLASYADRIILDEYYAYRVLSPQRATLGVKRVKDNMWKVSQIRLFGNGEPNEETIKIVRNWVNIV